MSRSATYLTVRPAAACLAMLLVVSTGCENNDDPVSSSGPPFDLTFSLDATFQAPHGGQPVKLAVVRSRDGVVVAGGSGTISSSVNPSYSFTALGVIERRTSYEVHYWIDSNINGGTAGVCDPKEIDHQWSVEFLLPLNDINFVVSYQPALTEDVCATFP